MRQAFFSCFHNYLPLLLLFGEEGFFRENDEGASFGCLGVASGFKFFIFQSIPLLLCQAFGGFVKKIRVKSHLFHSVLFIVFPLMLFDERRGFLERIF